MELRNILCNAMLIISVILVAITLLFRQNYLILTSIIFTTVTLILAWWWNHEGMRRKIRSFLDPFLFDLSGDDKYTIIFDDGPDNNKRHVKYMRRILKEINKNKKPNVRYVFALNGKNLESHHAEDIRNIIESGHEIANHSFSHKDYNKLSLEDCINDWEKNQDILEKYCGIRPISFQFPFHSENKEFKKYLTRKGYEVFPISRTFDDWRNIDSKELTKEVINYFKKGGRIITLHNRKPASKAIKDILHKM